MSQLNYKFYVQPAVLCHGCNAVRLYYWQIPWSEIVGILSAAILIPCRRSHSRDYRSRSRSRDRHRDRSPNRRSYRSRTTSRERSRNKGRNHRSTSRDRRDHSRRSNSRGRSRRSRSRSEESHSKVRGRSCSRDGGPSSNELADSDTEKGDNTDEVKNNKRQVG